MGNFELIKLTSDVLLVAAVCFLSFRILASGSLSGKTAQLMILEASLKGLIKDAEGTGRSLNDELQKRQYSLEKILSDLEGIEKRVTQSQGSIDQGRSQIDAQLLQAQHILSQITKIAASGGGIQRSVMSEPAPQVVEVMPEPPSFESVVVRPSDERHKLPERKPAQMSRAAAARQEVLQKQRLASQIEREVAVERTVEQVESAARDVMKISEQIEVAPTKSDEPQKAEKGAPADPRLGVLGGMKRITQTL